MAIGSLECYDSTGKLILSTQSKLTRVVYSTTLDGVTSGSVTPAWFIAGSGGVSAIKQDTYSDTCAMQVSISGNTVSWAPVYDDYGTRRSVATKLVVFMYA